MSSQNVILKEATIICPEEEANKFKYKIGDKFLLRKDTITTIKEKIKNTKDKELMDSILLKPNSIFTITSYCIEISGKLCYALKVNNPAIVKWQCTEEDLEKDFYKITSLRFALLEN